MEGPSAKVRNTAQNVDLENDVDLEEMIISR